MYDGEKLEPVGKEDSHLQLKIKMGELFYIDDNGDNNAGLRILATDDNILKWEANFFSTIIPMKKGTTELLVDVDYGAKQEVYVVVE